MLTRHSAKSRQPESMRSMRYGIAPPACPTSHRIFGSCLNTPAKQSFAIACGESRNFGLRLSLDEVHVRRREREDLGVDADAVHVFKALRHVGHRSGDPKEARSLEPDDPLTGRAWPEREVAAAPLDTFEVRRRV